MATATLEPLDEVIETQTRNVFLTLIEKDRRRFAAIQARQLGHGGITYISKLLDVSVSTISRGIDELDRTRLKMSHFSFNGKPKAAVF